ncbi:MAG: hypothetical protein AB7P76_07195 [Candidatus Melainabacteria bacterium]
MRIGMSMPVMTFGAKQEEPKEEDPKKVPENRHLDQVEASNQRFRERYPHLNPRGGH